MDLLAVGFWLLCALLTAGAALERRGNVIGYFVAGLIFGPFALLVAVVSPRPPCCRFCREVIQPGATVCPHCTRDLPKAPPP
jgi:hypothetical protein